MIVLYKILYQLNRKAYHLMPKKSWYKKLNCYFLSKLGVKFPTGLPSYIDPTSYFDSNYSLISVGGGTVVSRNVTLLTHDFSLTRALIAVGEPYNLVSENKPITIGKNCFIGASVMVLPGTVIGDNTIVGAGSVIKGNIPAGVVICGNPAKVIKTTEEYAKKYLDKCRAEIPSCVE